MNLLAWSYEESVKRVSAKVQEWKAVILKKSTLTDEIARELYRARGELRKQGARSDLVTNDTKLTWNQYLTDVGLAYRTVHRWLDHFDPQEQRLLSDDEYQQKEQEKQRKQMDHDRAIKHMAKERMQTGVIPADWNSDAEKAYTDMLIQEQKRKQWKEDIRRETQERESKYGNHDFSQANAATDNVKELLEELADRESKKEQLVKKMRLTGNNADHEFNSILHEYLDSLYSDSERLEACHNIIKICRAYVSEYQQKSLTL